MSIRPPAKSRRDALSFLAGCSGLAILSACTGGGESEIVVLDSYFTDPDARQAMIGAVEATSLATRTQVGTTNRQTFESSIQGYLRSRPGSVFTWSAGSGLSELITSGQLEHLSSVWTESDLNPRLRRLSSDAQGLPLFMPFTYDPWALFYSRREWVDAGYGLPVDADTMVSLSRSMAGDGVAAFGLDRLATPALLGLFDYINLSVNGIEAHRNLINTPGYEDSENRQRTLAVLGELAGIEGGLDSGAAVSIVPAPLSQASTRANPDDDLGAFVLTSKAIVAQVEGFALARGAVESSPGLALELLADLAEFGPQGAFMGDESGRLSANLNADYRAMANTTLRVAELVDRAQDIVESVATAAADVLTELTAELIATVRP